MKILEDSKSGGKIDKVNREVAKQGRKADITLEGNGWGGGFIFNS